MKITSILCASDTHTRNSELLALIDANYHGTEFDIFIHAGDFTNVGEITDVKRFNRILKEIPAATKIIIAGNHDWSFQLERYQAEAELENVIYLRDSFVTVNGLKIYGSPWTPAFCGWAFNANRVDLPDIWTQIPDDVNVLVTHGPAHGILDTTWAQGEHLGCEALRDRIKDLKNLKLHVFGHIHGGHGEKEHDGIISVNASTCNERYDAVNVPIVVYLES